MFFTYQNPRKQTWSVLSFSLKPYHHRNTHRMDIAYYRRHPAKHIIFHKIKGSSAYILHRNLLNINAFIKIIILTTLHLAHKLKIKNLSQSSYHEGTGNGPGHSKGTGQRKGVRTYLMDKLLFHFVRVIL